MRALRGIRFLTGSRRTIPALGVAAISVGLFAGGSTRANPAPPAEPFLDAVWVAEDHSVLKVGASDGRMLFEIGGVGEVGALAVDPMRALVWAFGPDMRLRQYSFLGSPLLTEVLSIHSGHCDDSEDDDDGRQQIVSDSRDGSAWLAFDGTVMHLSPSGTVLATLSGSERIRGISLDTQAGKLWVGTKHHLIAYNSAFHVVTTSPISRHDSLRALDIDGGSQDLFVAFEDGIEKRDPSGAVLLNIPIHGVTRVAADSRGGAWCSTGKTLIRIGLAGTIDFETNLFGQRITAIVGNPLDSSGWASSKTALDEIAADAQVLESIELGRHANARALALYVDAIAPSLSFASPLDGAVLNNVRPTFSLSYSDVGGGVDPATIAFRRGTNSISVTCASGSSTASCIPAVAFPQGLSTVTASIADHHGNTASATVNVTIDSIPPLITLASPSDGLLTNQPSLDVTGSLSESATLTMNGAPVAVAADLSFRTTVTLNQGANTLALRAADAAGNATDRALHATLDTTPPATPNGGSITVSAPASGTVTVSGGAGSVEAGATVIVTDSATGTTASVTAGADGSFAVTIAASGGDSLTIVARDAAGNSSAPTGATVPGTGPHLPPDPATIAPALDASLAPNVYDSTRFLYEGPDAIQTGVAAGAIIATQVCVLRGRVLDLTGAPISGATVTAPSHPELGQTLTRADGAYDFVANAGGTLTLHLAAAGFLFAERHVQPLWQDYLHVADIVLVRPDPAATVVALGSAIPQIAQSSISTDARGTRRATLFVPSGETASLLYPDGTSTALPQITLRLTEYTVGAAGVASMPAELPPTTNFTYAFDISADEEAGSPAGTQVSLGLAAQVYVEDFDGAPIGTVIPSGSYDSLRSAWAADPNGLVIEILPAIGGLAEIDVSGSGLPADDATLATLGFTDEERTTLASLYPPLTAIWRTPIGHFSIRDLNFANGKCQGACGPPPPVDPAVQPLGDPCNTSGGSTIECENRTLAEDFAVVGTPFSLHYGSDRQRGRAGSRHVVVPVIPASVPAGLLYARTRLSVAGRLYTSQFPAAPDQILDVTWDGLDAYGRPAGKQPATLEIEYDFTRFAAPTDALAFFAEYSGNPTVIIGTEPTEFAFSTVVRFEMGSFDSTGLGNGGLSLSVHHVYEPQTHSLLMGDGRRVDASQLASTVSRIAGGGTSSTDGIPADQTLFASNTAVVADPRGGYFVADFSRIRHVDAAGSIRTIAGSELPGFAGDGGPAISARLGTYLPGLALGPDGSLYVSDYYNHRVRRIAANGIITTVAGGGIDGSAEASDPASLYLDSPTGLAVAGDGSLYISDSGLWVIRRLTPGGRVVRVTGFPHCFAEPVEGGRASDYCVAVPAGLAFGPDGSLYFADVYAWLIRKIGPDGIITKVAGGGTLHCDGCASTDEQVVYPANVFMTPEGVLYFTETPNANYADATTRLKKMLPDGRVFTVFQTRSSGVALDGDPATSTQGGAYGIQGFTVASDGTVIASVDYTRVLKIHAAAPGFDLSAIRIPSRDGSQVFEFDAGGRHLDTRDALTGATLFTFGYDASGRVATVADRDGNITRIARTGSQVTITAPGGETTTVALDTNHLAKSIANPAGEARLLAMRSDGLLVSQTNPRGFSSAYDYDADGKLTKDSDAAGGSITLAESAAGSSRRVTETTAEGRTRAYTFGGPNPNVDARVHTAADGTLTATTETQRVSRTTIAPDGTRTDVMLHPDPRFGMQTPESDVTVTTPGGLRFTTSESRSAILATPGNPLSLVSSTETQIINGRAYSSAFDAASRTLVETTPEGRRRTLTLDSLGRVASSQTGTLAPVTLVYDTHGRVALVSQGSGLEARTYAFGYDPVAIDRLSSITDPLGRQVSFEYDGAGRVARQLLPDSNAVLASYDAASNLASLTPPGRPSHSFSYTPVDLQQAYVPPEVTGDGTRSTGYAYNRDKQLSQVSRPDARIVTPTYDAAKGRITALAYSAGTESFSYDATNGKLAVVTAPDGAQLSFAYDGPLPVSETWAAPATGPGIAGSVNRTFDSDFRLSTESVNGANTVAFGYDRDGLLVSAGDETITRDPVTGLITGTVLGGVSTVRSYNDFGEPAGDSARFGATSLYSANYVRDALGRITHLDESIEGTAHALDYQYDSRGRLTDVNRDGVQQSHYTFDANGNRLSKTGAASSAIYYVYDDQDRLLCERPSAGSDCSTDVSVLYGWTASGELASRIDGAGTTSYSYDEIGNLRTVVLPTGSRIDYLVDGANRRIGKVIDGVLVQGFLYRNSLKPEAELDGSGNVVSRFVYGSNGQVPDLIVKDGSTYRVVSDNLGTPRLIVGQGTGAVVERLEFDEWGNLVSDSDPGFQPFGFDGGLFDGTTALERFGTRDYSPSVGRWTKEDPIRFKGRDTNFYNFVRGDPVNLRDPSGHAAQVCVSGNDVQIVFPVFFTGPSNSPEAQKAFIDSVITVLSGDFGPWSVSGGVTTLGSNPADLGGPFGNVVSVQPNVMNGPVRVGAVTTQTGGSTKIEPGLAGNSTVVGDEMRHILGYEDEDGNFDRDFIKRLVGDLKDPGNTLPIDPDCACTADLAGQ